MLLMSVADVVVAANVVVEVQILVSFSSLRQILKPIDCPSTALLTVITLRIRVRIG